jgi:hypothetical protein
MVAHGTEEVFKMHGTKQIVLGQALFAAFDHFVMHAILEPFRVELVMNSNARKQLLVAESKFAFGYIEQSPSYLELSPGFPTGGDQKYSRPGGQSVMALNTPGSQAIGDTPWGLASSHGNTDQVRKRLQKLTIQVTGAAFTRAILRVDVGSAWEIDNVSLLLYLIVVLVLLVARDVHRRSSISV